MKLRNKKTGDVTKIDHISIPYRHNDSPCSSWITSIAQLTEEWEDYTPKEPLIKDEAKRNVFKAWVGTFANVSSTNLAFKYDAERYSLNNHVADSTIEFADCEGIDCEDREIYTIAELCGEEEE